MTILLFYVPQTYYFSISSLFVQLSSTVP